jgi:hypothetical protein
LRLFTLTIIRALLKSEQARSPTTVNLTAGNAVIPLAEISSSKYKNGCVRGSHNLLANKNTSLKFQQQFWKCHELRRPK